MRPAGIVVFCLIWAAACGARTGLGEGGEGGLGGAPGTASSTSLASTSSSSTATVTSASTTAVSVSAVTTSVTSTAVSTTAVTSTSSGPLCTTDEECDDGVDCTIDTCEPQGCKHAGDDLACDDGFFCTVDTCDGFTGCINEPTDDLCDDGIACTIDICDLAFDTCDNAPCDGLCDDFNFCDGVERCDNARGCVDGPPACDTGVACAISTCNELVETCTHSFPPGCTPPDVNILVTDDDGALWHVAPFGSPAQTLIANSNGTTHLDIAILGGRWFAADSAGIRELAPFTNVVIASLPAGGPNSMAAGPDGMLYLASNPVFRVHPDTGTQTVIGNLPAGHNSSGDVVFLGERMFVSTDSSCGGALVELDTQTGVSTVLGGDGLGCAYGLANVDGVIYVVNCDGKIGTFDPDTGEMRIVARTLVEPFGAEALP